MADVEAALQETGLPAHSLTIEITESVLVADMEASASVLKQLKRLGAKVALDDFGTGYSSLSYLKQFPIDVLKIDRTFVTDLGKAAVPDATLASAIVRLGQMLNLEIVAEGIEEDAEVSALCDLGCQFGQGFYFSRPLTRKAFQEFLAADDASRAASITLKATARPATLEPHK